MKVDFINTKSRPVTIKKGTLYGTAEAFQEANTTTYCDRLCLLDAGQMKALSKWTLRGSYSPVPHPPRRQIPLLG